MTMTLMLMLIGCGLFNHFVVYSDRLWSPLKPASRLLRRPLVAGQPPAKTDLIQTVTFLARLNRYTGEARRGEAGAESPAMEPPQDFETIEILVKTWGKLYSVGIISVAMGVHKIDKGK